jgi:tripartite-type tricarboxylate transporter receptor subunit TctC
MYQNMPFDPEKDFAPIALVGKSPILITARADAPFSTLKEFIAYAGAHPDSINGGFPGNGTLGHITAPSSRTRPVSSSVTFNIGEVQLSLLT